MEESDEIAARLRFQATSLRYWGIAFGLNLIVGLIVSAAEPPSILLQPTPTNVVAGAPSALSVLVSSESAPSFQWYRDGSKISAGIKSDLAFNSTGTDLAGLYWVTVKNLAGSVTSDVVSLSVNLPGSDLILRPRGSISGFVLGAGSGAPVRIQTRGNYAYVAVGWDTNLFVVDVSDPDDPQTVANVPVLGSFGRQFDVALIDNFALTSERGDGLGIIDITHPTAPVRIGNFKLPGSLANAIQIRGRHAFVGNENAGLVILDVDIPESPKLLAQATPPSRANGVYIDSDIAYIGNWGDGLSLVDISDSTAPKQLKSVSYNPVDARAFGVAFRNGLAYIADAALGLVVIDPSKESEQMVARIAGSLWEVSLIDRYVFAADSVSGFRIFDTSTPAKPVSIGRYGNVGPAIGAHVSGNRVYLGERRFSVLDMEFPRLAPAITTVPEERKVPLGSDVSLHVAATGTVPLTYRWLHGSVEIPANTGPNLMLPKITDQDLGDYFAVVSNVWDARTNLIATLSAGRLPDSVIWDSPAASEILIIGESYLLEPTSVSGRPVTLTLDSKNATLTASLLKPTAAGTVAVRALVSGDSQYLPTGVSRSFRAMSLPVIVPDSIQIVSDHIQFSVLVQSGIPFTVIVSDDLKTWRVLTTRIGSPRELVIVDSDEIAGSRFYRIEVR